jgi:hypothetical protein
MHAACCAHEVTIQTLLIAEVFLCFAPVVLLWLLGVFALLWQLTQVTQAIDTWQQIGIPLALIGAGLVGLVAATYIVAKLLSAAGVVPVASRAHGSPKDMACRMHEPRRC